MKRITTLFLILFPALLLAQTTKFSTVYSMDIDNISLMDVVKGPSGYYGAEEGSKFLILEGTLYSTVSKRVELQLFKMFVKTETDDYMGLANPSYVPFSDKDRFIRFKKRTKKTIYFKVDENFKEGVLVFDFEGIGKIRLLEDGISAELTPLEE